MIRRLLSTFAATALLAALVPAAAFAAEYTIVPTLPLQGDHVDTGRPTIAFQIHSGDSTNAVPQNAVHLVVDDTDVTSELSVEGVNLAYVPQFPLALGRHDVRVIVDDENGGEVAYSWSFFVDADNEQPSPDQAQQYQNNPYGTLTPAGDDFAYGDDAGFYFNGAPGGSGYLSFGGFPGFYPLIPVLGFPGLFYAAFPVPYGYGGGPIVVNFTNPDGTSGTFAPRHPVTFAPVGGPSDRRYVTGTGRVIAPARGTAGGAGSIPVAGPYAATLRFLPPVGARASQTGTQEFAGRPSGTRALSAPSPGYAQTRTSSAPAPARYSAPAPARASAPSGGGGHIR